MIVYSLKCNKNHIFEGYFRNRTEYDKQKSVGLVSCPACESKKIDIIPSGKPLLKSSVPSNKEEKNINCDKKNIIKTPLQKIEALRDYIEKNFENVGDKFYEHAYKMHHKEEDPRSIYGTATKKEQKSMDDEDVPYMIIPPKPEFDS